jgi:nuclear pore complex protein Nup98-Nup96
LTGIFSAAPAGGGQGGTKHTAYQATTRQDGTSSISMQTITAMQPYEHKSLEELRYEDYMMGNKGSGSATGATGGFSSTGFGIAPSSGFGTSNAFGKPATGEWCERIYFSLFSCWQPLTDYCVPT